MFQKCYILYYKTINSLSGTHTSVQSGCRHRRNVAAQGCGVALWHWCFVRRVSSWPTILIVTPHHTRAPMRGASPQFWARRPILVSWTVRAHWPAHTSANRLHCATSYNEPRTLPNRMFAVRSLTNDTRWSYDRWSCQSADRDCSRWVSRRGFWPTTITPELWIQCVLKYHDGNLYRSDRRVCLMTCDRW